MIQLKYKSWEDITIPVYQEIIDIAKGGDVGEERFNDREIDMPITPTAEAARLANIIFVLNDTTEV